MGARFLGRTAAIHGTHVEEEKLSEGGSNKEEMAKGETTLGVELRKFLG